ncbi:MAG: hypothetical protein AB2A00_13700, partial [Myxococcota bacterium]
EVRIQLDPVPEPAPSPEPPAPEPPAPTEAAPPAPDPPPAAPPPVASAPTTTTAPQPPPAAGRSPLPWALRGVGAAAVAWAAVLVTTSLLGAAVAGTIYAVVYFVPGTAPVRSVLEVFYVVGLVAGIVGALGVPAPLLLGGVGLVAATWTE